MTIPSGSFKRSTSPAAHHGVGCAPPQPAACEARLKRARVTQPPVTVEQLLALPVEKYIAPLQFLKAPLPDGYASDHPFSQSDGPCLASLQTRRSPGRPRQPPDLRPLVQHVADVKATLSPYSAEQLIRIRPLSVELFKALVESQGKKLHFYSTGDLNRIVDKVCFDRMDHDGKALLLPNVAALAATLANQERLPTFASLEGIQRYLLALTPAHKTPLEVLENLRSNHDLYGHLPTFSATSPSGVPRSSSQPRRGNSGSADASTARHPQGLDSRFVDAPPDNARQPSGADRPQAASSISPSSIR